MPFEANNTYGKGRIKGSKNKSTSEIKEMFKMILDQNLPDVQSWIDALDPKEKLSGLMSIASYCVPKLKASDIKFQPEPTQPLFLMPEEMEEMKNISNEAFKKVTGRDKSVIDGYED